MTNPTATTLPDTLVSSFRTRLPQVIVSIYLLIALVVFVTIPFLAAHWIGIPYFIGLIFLFCSLWIFSIRRNQVSGQAFAIFTASVAIATGCISDLYSSTHQFSLLWPISISLASAALIQLALTFPRINQSVLRFPWLVYIGYLPALILSAITTDQLLGHTQPLNYIVAWRYEYFFAGISVLFYFAWNIFHRFKTESPIEREQARIILVGAFCSFLPIGLWSIATVVTPRFSFSPVLLLPMVIFPVATGYTLQRYRLLQTDYILSRIVLYGSMTILAAGSFALIVSGLSVILLKQVSPDNPFLIGIFIFVLALILNPVRERLQHAVDFIFFRGERTFQEKVQTFSHDLTRSVDLNATLKLLRDYIDQALVPTQTHIFIYNASADQYVSTSDQSGQSTSDMRFASDGALVKFLQERRAPLFFSSPESIPQSLEKDRQRMAILAAQLYIPMPGRQRLAGWVALGPRSSAEPYTSSDLRFLESLGDQASVAVERAQIVTNMERRIYEMNILSRLALGINVTVYFDDILELIYAQTNQIIPTVDFYLALYDPETTFFQYVFYMENDDRIPEKESTPIPISQTLEQEIIRTRQPFLTNEYQNECRKLQVSSPNPDLKVWMGVPLNSGAETIGTISLASKDSSVSFSPDQLDLLQSIADQTAGGIVKARLLQETEQRAHQLTTLNEVTRQLTSTLETEPLLKNILQSAVDILNCEAGSLLLVDEQTDELVFRVTVGPVAENLIGRRMPPGSGVVGKSFTSRQPIIVNNVQNSNEWFPGTDNQTGYNTHSLLATPLEVKNNPIGVIEVINRTDGKPFTNDDQSLLSAFASQAAIAFENARLYTLTDQALSARVEELSVMQRVDRELNTSLDISRAMRITLEWAMRQSKTNAGLVGIIEEKGIRIMASQGYTSELAPYQSSPIPIELQPFQSAIQTGQLQQISTNDQQDVRTTLLINAHQQVVIPIRREVSAIGVILLESAQTDPLTEETLSFLNRLSDHAAIAISNAQLYTAVQAANVAKSEFVSFVSHELKNPMTSIKGYTELLAAGAVGPVNEAQANFLSTIRSNVERMSTLVSDLADVSRIEAGRLRLDFKPLSIFESADEVVRSLRRQIDEKQQQLKMEMPENLPQVWADRTRTNQILTNLINNASKYTPVSGQITIGAEFSQNQWDPGGSPEVIRIWVKDTGIGINSEDQSKIFQKFFRSEDPKTRESPGTGLGLNITKSLVEMQGGQIWFESVFRQGTTFNFTIPVAS